MLKKLFLFAFATLAFAACNDNKDEDNNLPAGYHYAAENPYIADGAFTGRNIQFFGTSKVTDAKGGVFTDDKANFEFAGGFSGADKAMTIYMHTTRFAAGMPAVEMKIPKFIYTGTGNTVAFNMPSVVPEALVAATGAYAPMPRYTITGLDGTINGIHCRVSFTCMTFQVVFEGRLIDNN